MTYDAVVVGAGPAGATCARYLAGRGLRTALIDKSAPPRYKTCGGGLVWRARRLLGVDIADCVEQESFVVEMHLRDDGLSLQVERPLPLVTMTMRSRLDHRLTEAAQGAGAELLAPVELQGVERQRAAVRLRTDRGELKARYLIAADGAASPTARLAGWPPARGLLPALESELEVTAADYDRFAGSARFDLGMPSHGYAWVFPKRNHLSVGCLSTRRDRPRLRRELERYLVALGLDLRAQRHDHGFVIPVRPRPDGVARDRVLLTGDAAGLADPVTCEGISWAVLSGRLAARAVVARFDRPPAVEAKYRRGLALTILPELRLARVLARLLYGWPRLRRLAFRRAGPSLCAAMSDVFSGREGYGSLLRSPGNYGRLARRLVRGS